MKRLAVVVALVLSGCAGPPAATSLTVDLERAPAPPDAGTQGGHHGGYEVTLPDGQATFGGTVKPAAAEVRADGAKVRRDGARWTVVATQPGEITVRADGVDPIVVRVNRP
jgi:hypothetical protein